MSVGEAPDLRAAAAVPAGHAAVPTQGRRCRQALLLGWALAASLLCGCAAVTNPVANGVEVRKLPPELLGHTRELPPVPFDKLRQDPPAEYRLDAGDVLGVWVEGVLGERGQAPPVIPTPPGPVFRAPALGFPIPVGDDGALRLPLVEPVRVAGLTLGGAEEAIRQAYTVKRHILQPGRERIIVTLAAPRLYNVTVIRQDAGGLFLAGGTGSGGAVGVSGGGGVTAGGGTNIAAKQGSGATIGLPAYENDVLHALAATGGLPGVEAHNEVIVLRKRKGAAAGVGAAGACVGSPGGAPGGGAGPVGGPDTQIVRIPLRVAPGAELPFRPEDVILQTGDIVYIPARDGDLFYTGGLLPPGEFVLPRDYDLDAVTAVMRILQVVNNNVGASGVGFGVAGSGATGPPVPSLLTILRRTADGGQVNIRVNLNQALADPAERVLIQPGDKLILQETPGEAFTRYVNTVLRFNFIGTIIRQRDLTATASLNLF